MIDDVLFTPLNVIETPKGAVKHGMKESDPGFSGFGEAYFSTVLGGDVKGWKKHSRMILNLVVPTGKIRFVFHDDRATAPLSGEFSELTVGEGNYGRVTVPAGIWMAFQGVGDEPSMLLNIASIEHDPSEAVAMEIESLPYDW